MNNHKITEKNEMIKFEIHEGQLFRMLEETVPHYRYELIGTFVKDGSKEWALYQMMQGEAVTSTYFGQPNRFLKIVDGYIKDSISDGFWDRKSGNEFLSYACSPGWQIYKEPKEEPAKEQFKVGDWVEYNGGFGRHIGRIDAVSPGGSKVHIYVSDTHGLGVDISCLRKLSPSKVIVKIGCLSGTVRPVSTNGIHIWFHLIDVGDKLVATIRISHLDSTTRELVESLLKAQREEK